MDVRFLIHGTVKRLIVDLVAENAHSTSGVTWKVQSHLRLIIILPKKVVIHKAS